MSSVGCPALQHFFTSIKIVTIVEKNLFNILCVFCVSLQLLSAIYLILTITEQYMIKNANFFHVKYPLFLPDFNETSTFLRYFRKVLKYQNSWKHSQWEPSCSMRTEGRMDKWTDMTKLIVAFCDFANAPKNDFPRLSKKIEPNVTHPEKSGF
jgi:hypothetical protein